MTLYMYHRVGFRCGQIKAEYLQGEKSRIQTMWWWLHKITRVRGGVSILLLLVYLQYR